MPYVYIIRERFRVIILAIVSKLFVPSSCLVVKALSTRQKVRNWNPDSGMYVCSVSDSILKGGSGLSMHHLKR